MNFLMDPFTSPLYLNKDNKLAIVTGFVNHSFQGWNGKIELEITYNIYNNPLKLENKHGQSAGRDMQTLLIMTNKVCTRTNFDFKSFLHTMLASKKNNNL